MGGLVIWQFSTFFRVPYVLLILLPTLLVFCFIYLSFAINIIYTPPAFFWLYPVLLCQPRPSVSQLLVFVRSLLFCLLYLFPLVPSLLPMLSFSSLALRHIYLTLYLPLFLSPTLYLPKSVSDTLLERNSVVDAPWNQQQHHTWVY